MNPLSILFPKKTGSVVDPRESYYKRVFENSQDGILLVDADSGVINEVAPYIYQLLGYEEFVGRRIWEVELLESIVPNQEAFEGLRKNILTKYENLPIQTKDGQLIKVTFISSVYRVGEMTVIQCNVREYTQSKSISETLKSQNLLLENAQKAMIKMIEDLDQAKKALEREKIKGDALVLSIGDGVIATDEYGRITVVNGAARRMMNWNLQDVYGRQLNETLVIEDAKESRVTIDANSTFLSEGFCVRDDKTKFPVAVNVKPIMWGEKIIGVVIVFRDITKEKEIERIKSEFISIATHQLKTPITGLRWSLQLLNIPDERLTDEQKAHLKNISNFIDTLANTVSDLLNVSRIELGTQVVEMQRINLGEFVSKFMEEIKPYAETSGRSIVLSGVDPGQFNISADTKLLHAIFQNLVSNAIEYSSPNSVVGIEIKQDGGGLLFSITNTGVTISEASRSHIFEKFYRAEEAKKIKEGGTGMGLYIVKLFIEKLGGRVGFESENGKTVFWFTLPL